MLEVDSVVAQPLADKMAIPRRSSFVIGLGLGYLAPQLSSNVSCYCRLYKFRIKNGLPRERVLVFLLPFVEPCNIDEYPKGS